MGENASSPMVIIDYLEEGVGEGESMIVIDDPRVNFENEEGPIYKEREKKNKEEGK